MKLSEIIREAIDRKGYKNLKHAAQVLGISSELLRVIVNKDHIPKDSTLARIAKKLDLDIPLLILAAHQEKVPLEVKGFFLTPSAKQGSRRLKRKYPLSEEQTAYLGQMLTVDEIMMLRKMRQMTDEARTQISGFVDFMYAAKKRAA